MILAALTFFVFASASSAETSGDGSAERTTEYVGDEKCLQCHDALNPGLGKAYRQTIHFRVLTESNALKPEMARGCEACHGPGKAHVDAGGDKKAVVQNFAGESEEERAEQNAVCVSCHKGGDQRFWHDSAHDAADVGCTSCHNVMRKVSPDNLLSEKTEFDTCGSCHQIQTARAFRNAHMPVRPGSFNLNTAPEAKMTCTSCHGPHGTVTEMLITDISVNDQCLGCHADKRGPFLWDHAPVTEDCLYCHDPHGTTRVKMLKLGVPRLCQTCHNSSSHPTDPRQPNNRNVLGSGCLQCHPNIHGSNHPSGFAFTR